MTAAAESENTCERIIEEMGILIGERGEYPDDPSGCNFNPSSFGTAQVMTQSGKFTNCGQGSTGGRQRVCACTTPINCKYEEPYFLNETEV